MCGAASDETRCAHSFLIFLKARLCRVEGRGGDGLLAQGRQPRRARAGQPPAEGERDAQVAAAAGEKVRREKVSREKMWRRCERRKCRPGA